MRAIFTGATGVIGRQALPALVDAGVEVTAVVRDGSDDDWIRDLGIVTRSVDLFDPVEVAAAMRGHDAVFHFATSIPRGRDFTKRASWTTNDRLRAEATGVLVDSARESGVRLFVQESVSFVYADGGNRWLDETAPVDPVWDVLDSALAAERHVQQFAAAGGTGVVLRLGRLYGPGKASADFLASVAKRGVPIVGDGRNFVSHLHVADAGTAVAAALSAPSGVYNVSDGMPVSSAEELSRLAEFLDAPQPRRLPYPVARAAVGRAAKMLTVSHRISIDGFRRTTGWEPSRRSVTEGWREVVAAQSVMP